MIDSAATYPRVVPVGEFALIIELGDRIELEINQKVYDLAAAVERAAVAGVQELVPTYRSLLIRYDPLRANFADLAQVLEDLARASPGGRSTRDQPRPTLYEIPVVYGGDEGPDLQTVAEHAGMSADAVISVHSGTTYRVYMLGFAPGFPYLGGLDPRIACPRLKTPRTKVPAGSVGIAENQTGVYPLSTPGGWQIIGRTPAPLFLPVREPPVAILPGSFVRFVRVSRGRAEDIAEDVAKGSYSLPTRRR
ncbi:MAG: 5-oxoprolinase subunit PxpB [Chloroflexi bacterium]|nr:5-oxoprolinase subunit PxpB [Chloroflexota bacterium]